MNATKRSKAATGPTVQQLAHDVWLVEIGPDLDAVLIANIDGIRQPIRGPYPQDVAELALSAVQSSFPTESPTPRSFTMCRTMTNSPSGSRNEREIRLMQQAAKRPGVVEFTRLVASARRLAHEINRFVEMNPPCELTETNIALQCALKDPWHDENPLPDVLRGMSALGFTLSASVDIVTLPMLESVFPECFGHFQDAEEAVCDDDGDEPDDEPAVPVKRSTRKPVCNRLQPFTA